ncbi:MAG: hypothetical protein ACO3N2_09450, partial [Arenicellales bacterium]
KDHDHASRSQKVTRFRVEPVFFKLAGPSDERTKFCGGKISKSQEMTHARTNRGMNGSQKQNALVAGV